MLKTDSLSYLTKWSSKRLPTLFTAGCRSGLCIMLFLCCLSGCGIFRKTEEGIRVRNSRYLLRELEKNQHDFQWLEARARIQYKTDKSSGAAKAFIRMRRDSAIWISVTPLLGIEAVRVLITPDSLTYLNRLQKKWSSTAFTSQLKGNASMAGMQFLDFQRLLIGDVPQPLLELDYNAGVQDRSHTLQHQDTAFSVMLELYPGNLEPGSISYRQDEQTSMRFRYSDYQQQGDFGLFPERINMRILAARLNPEAGPIGAELKLSRVTQVEEALSMPFSIPSSYDRTP